MSLDTCCTKNSLNILTQHCIIGARSLNERNGDVYEWKRKNVSPNDIWRLDMLWNVRWFAKWLRLWNVLNSHTYFWISWNPFTFPHWNVRFHLNLGAGGTFCTSICVHIYTNTHIYMRQSFSIEIETNSTKSENVKMGEGREWERNIPTTLWHTQNHVSKLDSEMKLPLMQQHKIGMSCYFNKVTL